MKDVYPIEDSDEEKQDDDPEFAEAIRLSRLESSNSGRESSRPVPVMTKPAKSKPTPPRAAPSKPANSIPAKRKSECIIDLCTDGEESDLEGVIEARKAPRSSSHQQSARQNIGIPSISSPKAARDKAVVEQPTALAKSSSGKTSSFFRTDRKQMERERLERIRKAKVTEEVVSVAQKSKATEKSGEVEPTSFYGKPALLGSLYPKTTSNRPSPGLVGRFPSPAGPSSSAVSKSQRSLQLQYPNGVVKKTFAGKRRTSGDITIEEVLQKDTLTTAVLSAFQWHHEWVMSKLPLRKPDLQLVLVHQAKEIVQRLQIEELLEGLPKTRLVFPSMEGQVNCMHSKLMLLFHKDKKAELEWLRICVPSANLTNYDWGEMDGLMENMCFLIDLPRLPASSQTKPNQTLFLKELHYFCTAQGMPRDVLDKLSDYDFEKTKPMAFVHSIGGSHAGSEWKRTGYCGLGSAVKALGYASGGGLEVDFVTSSLGAANEQFISNIYHAAMGDNGSRELQRRLKPKATSKAKGKEKRAVRPAAENTGDEEDSGMEHDEDETSWDKIKERFRAWFPSRETVAKSRGGLMAAGTICFQSQWWNSATFPKSIVRDCESVRQSMLMHNKLLFARPSKQLQTPAGKVDAWAYVGSANLSESAWGKLVIDRTTKTPKLNCKNWECGVIVPVLAPPPPNTLSGIKEDSAVPRNDPLGMEIFRNVVPVPMKTTADIDESMVELGREPWFFGELRKMGY